MLSLKNGSLLSFNLVENSENLGRGWIVHKIECFINKREVGFIKISFIPKENFDKEFPTIVHYLEKIEGKSLSLPNCSDERYRSDYFNVASLAEQAVCLKSLCGNSEESLSTYQAKSKKSLTLINKRSTKLLEKRFGASFEKFKAFHCDKPLVDYISVDEEFRRQRIGIALYTEAAKYLSGKGLSLYASGIQSPRAKASWDWIRNNLGSYVKTEADPCRENSLRTILTYPNINFDHA